MPERILDLSRQVSSIATSRVEEIRKITGMTKILSLNAAIEAARSGNAAFGVVAGEVSTVSASIDQLASTLRDELSAKTTELEELGQKLIASIRGSRLADLAHPSPATCDLTSGRLGVILDSYTVYLDLWVASVDGKVLANGRPRHYSVQAADVSREEWFRKAMETKTGADFVACDISNCKELGNAAVATYATAVRAGGRNEGKIIGALGIFFDWEKQSQLVVDSVRLAEEERAGTRCMILNAAFEVIASTRQSDLNQVFPLTTTGRNRGSYVDPQGNLVGFALISAGAFFIFQKW